MPPQTPLFTELPTVFVADAVRELPFSSYLDVGCGTGGFSIAVALEGRRVLGIDPNDAAVSLARLKVQGLHLPLEGIVNIVDFFAEDNDPKNRRFMGYRFGDLKKEILGRYGSLDDEYAPKFMGDFHEHEVFLGNVSSVPDVRFAQGNLLDGLGPVAQPYDCVMCLNVLHFFDGDSLHLALGNLVGLVQEGEGLIVTLGSGAGFRRDYWDCLDELGFEKSPVSDAFEDRVDDYASYLMMSGILPEDRVSFGYSGAEKSMIACRCASNGYSCLPPKVRGYIGVRKHVPGNIESRVRKSAEFIFGCSK